MLRFAVEYIGLFIGALGSSCLMILVEHPAAGLLDDGLLGQGEVGSEVHIVVVEEQNDMEQQRCCRQNKRHMDLMCLMVMLLGGGAGSCGARACPRRAPRGGPPGRRTHRTGQGHQRGPRRRSGRAGINGRTQYI